MMGETALSPALPNETRGGTQLSESHIRIRKYSADLREQSLQF